MGIMTFMRTKMGYFLVGGIAVVLALFVLEPLLQRNSVFTSAKNIVGSIDGNEVKYEEFNPKVDQSLAQLKQQYGGSGNAQMQAMAVDNVWQSEIASVLLDKEINRLGLSVSGDELFSLVQGNNPSPLIMQSFADQQTGQLNRTALFSSLKARESDQKLKSQWLMLEAEIEKQALQKKYVNLVNNSVYVTSLEANDEYINRNKLANFNYVNLDFASIADNSVKPTDQDYADYYEKNKLSFNNPAETRSLAYVSFNLNPTKTDSLAIKTQLDKLAADFKVTPNDSLFAAINSDTKTIPYSYVTKARLDPTIAEAIFNYPVGSFYGPIFSGNSYKLAKIVDVRMSPDSVKASHILIDPSKVGGEAAAMKLADSLKNRVLNGGSLAALAKIYSVDGSKDSGGDLGTFTRGQMVPEFDNACFNGKTGDLKIVRTQFGVHLLKIEKQVGFSKVVKLAYIEKNLTASNTTRDAAYKKAINFLNEVDGETFNSLAKTKGYTVALADKITASQGYAAGLDNPRKLIQDAFNNKKDEKLPEVYTMDNAYVVACLTAINPKGQLELADVKKEIAAKVLNQVKAKLLTERLQKAIGGLNDINQVASKLGKTAQPVQNIVFANPVIPGLTQENNLVGAVFGSAIGKLSKPIVGESGVFVFSLLGFSNPAPLANTFKQKETMVMGIKQRSTGAAFQVLKDKSNIKDNRVKFY
jgi:peptidyl-prolyl cis-trans isomerase D